MNPAAPLAAFYRQLQVRAPPGVFNPWRDRDALADLAANGPKQRLVRLQAHLDCDARLVLVGEAAGYQGCHVSGIPFTSERLILAGAVPRILADGRRLSTRERPWSEPSASIVWGALRELGVEARTVLWNAYPWHPHKPSQLQSNRTPTRGELQAGLPVLETLLAAFPRARVVAVGRKAEAALDGNPRCAVALRHPAMGGATEFRKGLRALLGA